MLLLKGFNPIVFQGLDLSNVMYTCCLILWLNGLSRKLWSNAQEMVRPELCTYILGNFCLKCEILKDVFQLASHNSLWLKLNIKWLS